MLLGQPLRVPFLNVGAVEEHDGAEVAGGRRGEDATLVTMTREHRKNTTVVDVGMAQNHRIQVVGIKRQRAIKRRRLLANTLEHAAIKENLVPVDFQKVFTARDPAHGSV